MILRQVFRKTSFVPSIRALIAISRLGATDSRNIIYAILGIICDANQVVAHLDYTASLTQVYGSLVYHYARLYGRLDLLCLNQWQKDQKDLPSWIPDFHTIVHLQYSTMMVQNIHMIESVTLSAANDATCSSSPELSVTLYNERKQNAEPNLFLPPVEVYGASLREVRMPWGYRADGGSLATVSITANFRVMTVSVILMAPIANLGAHLVYGLRSEEAQGLAPKYIPAGRLSLEQLSHLRSPYSTDEAFRVAVIRTIRLCPCLPKHCNPCACPCQWDERVGLCPCGEREVDIFAKFVQPDNVARYLEENSGSQKIWMAESWSLNKTFRMGMKTLEDLFVSKSRGNGEKQEDVTTATSPPPYDPRSQGDMMRFSLVISQLNRRLMANTVGALVMVPHEARVGDCVCIVLGGSIPLLLRKNGEHWKIIGEAYVYAIMQSRVIRMAHEGMFPVEQITLC